MSDIKKINYEIYKFSSYSTSYLPENIREDCPSNQTSRWSSNTNNPPQFLTLILQRPAVVKQIKFGKYEKTHVCNLKKFRVYGGLEPEHSMVLLFEGGLTNDSIPETFKLRHTTDSGELLPVMFIQIMPLLSWGPSFNFSIWYVELHGEDEPIFVRNSLRNYNMLREIEIVKLCLKHFRQQGYDAAFRALQDQTNVHLESESMSKLHDLLVIEGDFNKTEDFIANCIRKGLMDDHLAKQDYRATWCQEIISSDLRPGTRGGHQLIIDTANNILYLYGGWDGFGDLSDLWSYNIISKTWTLIHNHSENFDGPTPRSCHKMIYDPTGRQIFTLGRYLDNSVRTKEYMKSDFYLYDTTTQNWLLICDDTSHVGGPQLVYDHQMCIDVAQRTIYVFGGKILTPKSISSLSTENDHSGLFSYHIATNTWTQIFVDCAHPTASDPDVSSIKSRVTHCMVFHNTKRKLYIFGGQRGKDDITDFMSYDVDTQKLETVNIDNSNGNTDNKSEPLPGFTQRATIDCEKDEIYVLSSLSKQKDRSNSKQSSTSNSFWIYSLKDNTWNCIYKSDHSTDDFSSTTHAAALKEPCPRFAHQLVYDPINKVHYLFGGNPGRQTSPQLRLDDFWILLLEKPTRENILCQCKYLIRKLKFEEITKTNAVKAVKYLQNELSEVIDHSDPEQLSNFHKLASLLFSCDSQLSQQTALMTFPLGKRSKILFHDKAYSKEITSEEVETDSEISDDSSTMNSPEDTASAPSPERVVNEFGKRSSIDRQMSELKNQRCLLYNRLVGFMPAAMVQPKGNLSDFVLI